MNAISPVVLPGKSFDLNTFTFNGIALRTVLIDGKAWFPCRDVVEAVGNDRRAVQTIRMLASADEYMVVAKGETGPEVRDLFRAGARGSASIVSLVSESGLYKYTLRAQRSNPAARDFQDWVTKEVLPRIRRDGAYIMGEEKVATGASPQMPQIRPPSAVSSRPISP